ncbi:hypothetical protein TREMEDRAFT_30684 [Tremella mesenterica DSM 1558]|uniref:uncharacterized protein n=1 Tax=Tremella mesenterica (strain ATCC 24925 / CBS 8224 / DSM 1558 / NBRC 9311 / NRRL Y-6157 / RJB 2259-6 / UBC 559-6) TaxID=578456 RepID=UPI0003F497AE|nr:uncharacterized protein TREMEDRAFT_30684 [Tremella mesenterica DSM 1558]EIW69571.1 hypothetical protein TREMEDRAFT_30684 [Tremella mesenterica DSM 1558]
MIDSLLGRPSPLLRRTQVFLVLFFWIWRLVKGDGGFYSPTGTTSANGPLPSWRVGDGMKKRKKGLLRGLMGMVFGKRGQGWIGRMNERLKKFSPYQLILGTWTIMYALRHMDDLFGIGAPEPLATLYSRSYYRATYINTALDAGFASAMSIRPKWLKDMCSMLFSVYYLIWANEADEVLRRFRALCSVEMLRTTWEKTRNPYIRMITSLHCPSLPIVRSVSIPRPSRSSRAGLPPVKGMLFFSGNEAELAKATQLIIDFPGGGFVAMGPDCHEERLRSWAKRTGKPVLAIEYGKAPEYPYPWAIEEGFDAYRTIHETLGSCIGIHLPNTPSSRLSIVLTGDSAGGNICATIMLRILEHSTPIPRPVSIILAYPALDFNFTSWMSPANLRVLRTEQSESHLTSLKHGKDHLAHKSPLSVVDDTEKPRKTRSERQRSWGDTLGNKLQGLSLTPTASPVDEKIPLASAPGRQGQSQSPTGSWRGLPRVMSTKLTGWLGPDETKEDDDAATVKAADDRREEEKPLRARVKTPKVEREFDLVYEPAASTESSGNKASTTGEERVEKVVVKKKKRAPFGTRLTMTSRVGYFQDRIISPSMMRAMAILYIGPRRNPDFETDYYISPILSPPHLLQHFPPVYLICGERDPFVDDTVIFAGKIREAKRGRKAQAEFASQGKSAKFGESLRMSVAKANASTPAQGSSTNGQILRETDEDWVQMRIIEGWGHGFMQMAALMREVDSVLTEMADWIDESFIRSSISFENRQIITRPQTISNPNNSSTLDPTDSSSTQTHSKPIDNQIVPPNGIPNADLGAVFGSDVKSLEDDNIVTFTPKSRSRRKFPPPSQFLPVARKLSKEKLTLDRNLSAPTFDLDETGSSGEAFTLKTPPTSVSIKTFPPEENKGSGAFAFFKKSDPQNVQTQTSSSLKSNGGLPTGRGQSVGVVSEAELMRRRRKEAVFGMGVTDLSDGEDDEHDGDQPA